MRKIMLVIEDYTDMVSLENLLRRLGFDVLSVSREVLVIDAFFRFFPDIVISTAKGRQLDGFRVAARLKKLQNPPRMILAHSAGTTQSVGNSPVPPEVQEFIVGNIQFPILAEHLIQTLAEVGGLNGKMLYEKYLKFNPSPSNQPIQASDQGQSAEPRTRVEKSTIRVQSTSASEPSNQKPAFVWDPIKTPGESARARSDRSDRYDKFLAAQDPTPVDGVLPKDTAAKAMKELEENSKAEKNRLDVLDEVKRNFVKALFEHDSLRKEEGQERPDQTKKIKKE
jgi:CheY-like chemotaxis protein